MARQGDDDHLHLTRSWIWRADAEGRWRRAFRLLLDQDQVVMMEAVPTVARIRKRFVQGRVSEAITERYRKGGDPSLTSDRKRI